MNEYVTFKTRIEFRDWLAIHCLTSEGVWLCFDKQMQTTLKASEALEEALCFGWIDGQMKRIDDNHYIKYFSLRRKHSKWSQKNKALAMELEKKGLMNDIGREKIAEAKKNGQWENDNTIIVDEQKIALLIEEIKAIEPAYTNFLAMPLSIKKTYTKAYLDPKTAKGKQTRLEWIIDRLNHNLKPM